jgi:SAM-dependent methyltransferase
MDRYDARTYGDGYADVYDRWYGDLPGADDAVATLAELAAGGPVLELAVGTGRLAVPLAATGVRVVGVDASAPMLAQLVRNDPAGSILAVRADMAALPFAAASGFALAFVAVNSLFNVFTAEGQRRCLLDTAAALRSGGALVVEAFVPDERSTGAGVVEPRTIEPDRVTLFVSRQDPVAQTVSAQIIEITAEGNRLRPVHLRYLTPAQLDGLAVDAGLELEQRWQDWTRTAFTDDSPTHVSLYRRP